MCCSIGRKVRTEMADFPRAKFRFAVFGDRRIELWELTFGCEGMIVCRAVFERVLIRRTQ